MGLGKGTKRTDIGDIPKGWGVCTLSDAAEFLNDKRRPIKSSDRAKMRGQYPYYGASGIVDYVNDYIFDESLILLGEDGENILSRSVRLAFLATGKYWVNNHAHVLRPKDAFDIIFLCEFLESIDYGLYNTGTAQPKLNKKTCSRIPVALPPLQEQKNIATALSGVDALIQKLDKLIRKKRDMKTAVMQQLLTGKKRLPGFGEGKRYKQTEVGAIPEDWHVKKLSDVSHIDPENLSAKTHPDYVFNYIALENVNRGHLDKYVEVKFIEAPSRARRILRENDVLIATVRPNLQSHLLIDKSLGSDFVGSTGFAVVRVNKDLLLPEYLFAHLFSGSIKKQIDAIVTGSNYPAISRTDVEQLEIPLPELNEQNAISLIISCINSEIDLLSSKVAKTKAIKQGMMQELLTGKTRLV